MKLRIVAGVLLMTGVCASRALASGTEMERVMPRLRPVTPQGKMVIDEAARRSATVRALAAEIAASDLIVYVELNGLLEPGRGGTKFVAVTGGIRYLRITLSGLTPPAEQIPLLAHELQHAVEIARAPHIRDTASLRAHYIQIGEDPAAHSSFETADARNVQVKVRREFLRKVSR